MGRSKYSRVCHKKIYSNCYDHTEIKGAEFISFGEKGSDSKNLELIMLHRKYIRMSVRVSDMHLILQI